MGFSRKMKRKHTDQKELLQHAFDKGYEAGRKQGIDDSIDYLSLKMNEVRDIHGVGDVTALKIAEHFGFHIEGEKK